MLKENEKRIFWIAVMAVAVVSLVAAWASSFIVAVDYMIDSVRYLGKYIGEDLVFIEAILLLVLFVAVATAVIHLATKGRNCKTAKIVWASVIGGFVLLSSVAFTVVFYCVDEATKSPFLMNQPYQALIGYITNTITILISYEMAFWAQMMLLKKPKQGAEKIATEPTENTPQE